MKQRAVSVGRNRSWDAEQGIIVAMLGLGVAVIIIGFAALILNYSLNSYYQRFGQSAIDTAALSAASTFCSTQACFNDALSVATDSLETYLPEILGLSTEFDLPAADYPEWEVEGVKVTIQRGRWWPDGVPANLASHVLTHQNRNFEPIDLLDVSGGTWQQGFPGIPQYVVANAVYVKVEYTSPYPVLNIFGNMSATMKQETYAAVGQLKGANVCAAPFALHVCSLLNEEGEYDKDNNCRFERYFTNANRYCPESDPDCAVLPGTTWTPMIDPQDYVAQGNFGAVGMPTREKQFRPLCSWETYPRALDVRDHFGLVGLPLSATIDGIIDEAKVLRVIDSPPQSTNVSGGCTDAKLGDVFVVLQEGLTNTVDIAEVNAAFGSSDALVWSQIQDEAEGTVFHPDLKDSMLKGGAPTVRYRDDYFAADSHMLTYFDQDLDCTQWPRTRYGHCNSKHMISDNEWFAGYFPEFYDCPNGRYGIGSCWCDHYFTPEFYEYMDVYSRPPDGLAGNFWYQSESGEGFWDPNAYFDTSLDTLSGGQSARRLPVWKVPIPVIASMGDLEAGNPPASCDGVNEDPEDPINHDPNFNPTETYIIIGFIEVVLYDTDIGSPPPPDSSADNCEWIGSEYGILAGRRPLGFEVNGVKTDCNVVKGTSHCTNNVLSSVLAFQQNSTPAGRLYTAGVDH